MRRRHVGNAQGWYYPSERTIILWECFFDPPYRREPAAEDPNLAQLWRGFERFLLNPSPGGARIVTTHTDPVYEDVDYQQFLRSLGYERIDKTVFGKAIG